MIADLPLVFVAIIIVIIASAIGAAAKALIESSLSGVSYAKVLGNAVAGLILALGIIAALDQLHVATNVVNAVLYAALAALAAGDGGRPLACRGRFLATRDIRADVAGGTAVGRGSLSGLCCGPGAPG